MNQHINGLDTNTDDSGQQPNHGVGPVSDCCSNRSAKVFGGSGMPEEARQNRYRNRCDRLLGASTISMRGPTLVDPLTLHAAEHHQWGVRRRHITIQRNQQTRSDNKAADHSERDATEPPQHAVGAICGLRGRVPPVSGVSAQRQD